MTYEARRAAIGQAFVDHVAAAADHYRAVAQARVGRDIAHVLLLHASALTADHLGALLDRLAVMGFAFVPLDAALADPVYARADGYAGRLGMSWLYRIDRARPSDWGWDVGQARALGERFGIHGEGLRGTVAVRIDRDLLAREVAPHTLVIVHEKPFAANSLVAELPDGTLLLAGSPYTPDAARRLLAWLHTRYGERKIIAIATHFHFDASGSIAAWIEAGARVVASDLTAQELAAHRKTLGRGMMAFLKDDPEQAAAFEGLETGTPPETFVATKGLVIEAGGERVEVRYPGPGHTRDNVVVWFPARKVLFGGCFIVGMPRLGYTGDADLARWPASLRNVMALPAEVVVPGHGERLGANLLAHTLRLVTAAGRVGR